MRMHDDHDYDYHAREFDQTKRPHFGDNGYERPEVEVRGL